MQSCRRLIFCLGFALCLLSFHQTAIGESDAKARELFDSLFGKRMKAVAKTISRDDDVALANQLLAAAKTSGDEPAFQFLLCNAAHELGARHPDGYATAADALRLAITAQSESAAISSLRDDLVGLLTRMTRTGDADSKAAAGSEIVDVLTAQADADANAGDHAAAAKRYKRAMLFANRYQPDAVQPLGDRIKGATARALIDRSIKSLQQKLLKDANDFAAAQKLVMHYVTDLDQPAKAIAYLARMRDYQLKAMVPLAAKEAASVNEAESLALGEWYQALSTQASDTAKHAMLQRTATYLDRFLKLHGTSDLSAKKAEILLTTVRAELAKAKAYAASSPNSSTNASAKAYQPPDGCVAYWSMDQSTAFERNGKQYMRNLIADDNHLRVHNTKTTRARFGESLYFNGQDAYGVVEGNRTLDKYTIVLWFNVEAITERNPLFLDAHRAGFNSHGRPDIRLSKTGQVEATGGWNTIKYDLIQTSKPVRTDSWQAVALTVDAPTKTVTLVHNNKVVGTSKNYAEPLYMKDNGSNQSRIELGTRMEKRWFFKGAIDEVMIFENVLSATDLRRVLTRR